jgi:predicted dinucleotide-binding enzyme
VVKAFNTTGAENMADPIYQSQPITMFICGDDGEAKAVVAQLAEALGFEVADTGKLAMARYLEPLANCAQIGEAIINRLSARGPAR